jgi:uncharacterized delta-60 repeat protein
LLAVKKRYAAFLLAGLCIVAVPPTTQASASLDMSFGVNGRVLTASSGSGDASLFPGPQMASGGDGRTLIATGREVLRYRADGSLDSSFGQGGRIAIAVPSGVEFRLADLAVDSEERIVLVGSAVRQPPAEVTYGPTGARPQYALVIRYLAEGRLDPSFGSGAGMVETGFGLPLAASTYGTAPNPPYVAPSGVVIDTHDRIVLSGNYLSSVVACTATTLRSLYTGFIARLSPDGSLEPSFGQGGLRLFSGRNLAASVAATRRGALQVLANRTSSCGSGPGFLGRFAADGGAGGWRRLDFGASILAIDSKDRVLVLGSVEGGSGRHPNSWVAQVHRYLADGEIDSGFGREGRSNLLVPGLRSSLRKIVIGRNGGILLTGSHLHPHGHPRGATFMVMRLDREGDRDRGFGLDGRIETRFGTASSAVASDAMIDPRGRLLVAGAATAPSFGTGLALARYLVAPRTGSSE